MAAKSILGVIAVDEKEAQENMVKKLEEITGYTPDYLTAVEVGSLEQAVYQASEANKTLFIVVVNANAISYNLFFELAFHQLLTRATEDAMLYVWDTTLMGNKQYLYNKLATFPPGHPFQDLKGTLTDLNHNQYPHVPAFACGNDMSVALLGAHIGENGFTPKDGFKQFMSDMAARRVCYEEEVTEEQHGIEDPARAKKKEDKELAGGLTDQQFGRTISFVDPENNYSELFKFTFNYVTATEDTVFNKCALIGYPSDQGYCYKHLEWVQQPNGATTPRTLVLGGSGKFFKSHVKLRDMPAVNNEMVVVIEKKWKR